MQQRCLATDIRTFCAPGALLQYSTGEQHCFQQRLGLIKQRMSDALTFRGWRLVILGLLCACLKVQGGNDQLLGTASPVLSNAAAWQRVWEDFQNQYSYFDYKEINWNAVFEEHKNGFEGLTPDAFAEKLNTVLQVLHDRHVSVRKPDGTLIGYQTPYVVNAPSRPYSAYATNARYESVNGANVIGHALIASNIAHIIITTLDTATFAAITDQDIERLFVTYREAAGMILDLRYNSGGNENNALRFASRLIDAPRTYGHYRFRVTNSVPYQFGPLTAKTLNPNAGTRFRGPIVGLIGKHCMSSAEWFAQMIKVCPNAILVGETTRGSSGNPVSIALPGLNLSYTISRWIGYTDEQIPFEDKGITPAIQISAAESFDDAIGRDYVLERAIHYIQWREAFHTESASIRPADDYDNDGFLNLNEYWAGTDPANAQSLLSLMVSLRGSEATSTIELSWPSAAGKRYDVLLSDNLNGRFLALSTNIVATPPLNVFVHAADSTARSRFFKIALAEK
jgi:hypothetical protein